MSAKPHPASPEARSEVVLGVVGGSGLYQMDGLQSVESRALDTPFGSPSGPYTVGRLPRPGGRPIKSVFLPRHGDGHRLLPAEINYRANIHGFKQLGVTHLLSVSAVGSLREEIVPGHVVVADQFIDRTHSRQSTFFGDGVAGHVQFGDPVDPELRGRIVEVGRGLGATVHDGGTCIVMEGPAFSTRAESEMYRSWGAHVIGMTALPEAKLAREAEISYALVAMATDYDCWREGEDEVSVEAVIAVLRSNAGLSQSIAAKVAAGLPESTADLPVPRACETAVLTAADRIPPPTRKRLDLIIGHYL